jgi:hypothetical protein
MKGLIGLTMLSLAGELLKPEPEELKQLRGIKEELEKARKEREEAAACELWHAQDRYDRKRKIWAAQRDVLISRLRQDPHLAALFDKLQAEDTIADHNFHNWPVPDKYSLELARVAAIGPTPLAEVIRSLAEHTWPKEEAEVWDKTGEKRLIKKALWPDLTWEQRDAAYDIIRDSISDQPEPEERIISKEESEALDRVAWATRAASYRIRTKAKRNQTFRTVGSSSIHVPIGQVCNDAQVESEPFDYSGDPVLCKFLKELEITEEEISVQEKSLVQAELNISPERRAEIFQMETDALADRLLPPHERRFGEM